jgi:hypothetical protein
MLGLLIVSGGGAGERVQLPKVCDTAGAVVLVSDGSAIHSGRAVARDRSSTQGSYKHKHHKHYMHREACEELCRRLDTRRTSDMLLNNITNTSTATS